MEYRDVVARDRRELEILLESGNEGAIIDALVSAAFHEPDWRWVQARCLQFLDQSLEDVRRTAAICLGHLARIHGELDLDVVLPRLQALRNDKEIGGVIEDALDDIRMFIHIQ